MKSRVCRRWALMYCSKQVSATDIKTIALICDAPSADFASYSGAGKLVRFAADFSLACDCVDSAVGALSACELDLPAPLLRIVAEYFVPGAPCPNSELLQGFRQTNVFQTRAQLDLVSDVHEVECHCLLIFTVQVKYCRTVARNSDGAVFFEISVSSTLPCSLTKRC